MKKKLTINRETVRILRDLTMIVGGRDDESTGVPCITYICSNEPGCWTWSKAVSCPEWMCEPPPP